MFYISFYTQMATSWIKTLKGKDKWQLPCGIAYATQATKPNSTKPKVARNQAI